MHGRIIKEEWQLCFQHFFKKYLFIFLNVSFYLLMIGKLSKIRTWSAFCFSVKKFQSNFYSSGSFRWTKKAKKRLKIKSANMESSRNCVYIVFDCFTTVKSNRVWGWFQSSKYIKNNPRQFPGFCFISRVSFSLSCVKQIFSIFCVFIVCFICRNLWSFSIVRYQMPLMNALAVCHVAHTCNETNF